MVHMYIGTWQFYMDVYGVRIYPRSGVFTERFDQTAPLHDIGSDGYSLLDNPQLFPQADIRSVPLRNTQKKSAPLRDIFKGGYPLWNPVAPVAYQIISSSLVQVSFVSSSPAECILV